MTSESGRKRARRLLQDGDCSPKCSEPRHRGLGRCGKAAPALQQGRGRPCHILFGSRCVVDDRRMRKGACAFIGQMKRAECSFCHTPRLRNSTQRKQTAGTGGGPREAAVSARAVKQARRYLIVQTAEWNPSKLPNRIRPNCRMTIAPYIMICYNICHYE